MMNFFKKTNSKVIISVIIILFIATITSISAFFIHSESLKNIFSFNLKSYLARSSNDNFWSSEIENIKDQITAVKFVVSDEETILESYNNSTYKARVDDQQKFGNKIYAFIEENNGKYELVISSKSKIYLPSDSSNMFEGFSSLASLDLSASNSNVDTSLVEYISAMFNGCSSLTELNISALKNADLKKIDRLFLNCSSLENIVGINDLNVTNVEALDWIFQNCSNLKSLDLSNWNITNKVTTMWGLFDGCSALETLKLGTFDTSNVTNMNYIFQNCSKLTSLDINSWDVSKVVNFNSTFRGMTSLTSLDLSNWETSSATDMFGMFLGDTDLVELKVNKFDTSNVTDMRYMFQNLNVISNLDVSSFVIDSATELEGLFDGMLKITNLDISNMVFKSESNNIYMFRNMPLTAKVKVKDCNVARWIDENLIEGSDFPTGWSSKNYYTANESYCVLKNAYMINLYGSSISTIEAKVKTVTFEKLTLAEINNALTEATNNSLWNEDLSDANFIGEKVYGYATINASDSSLYDIHIVSTAQEIYFPGDSSWMFSGFKNSLTSVDFKDMVDTSLVYNLSALFNGCSALETVNGIANFNTENVEHIDWIFQNCSKLKSLDLSGWNITNKVTTMWGIFVGCKELAELKLGTFDTSNVTIMNYLFQDCSKLTSLDVSNWNVSKVVNFNSTFRGMTSLTSLDLSNWETSSATEMFGMFLGDSSLTDLKVDKFDTSNVTDMRFMFQNITRLTSLNLKSFVIDNVTQAMGIFDYMTGLLNLDISNFTFKDSVSYENIFRNMPANAKIKVKDCSIVNWIINNLVKDTDYPSGWTSLAFYTDSDVSCPIGNAYMINLYGSDISEIEAMVNSVTFETLPMSKILENIETASNANLWNKELTDSTFDSEAVYGYATINATDSSLYDIHIVSAAQKIYFPENSSWMFSGFKNSLTSVDFKDIVDTSLVSNFSSLFNGCSKLETINGIEKFDTKNVQYIDWIFQNCSKLKSLDLSNWTITNKVTTMWGLFDGCSALETLKLGTFDTSNVTNMNYVFQNCSKLTSLDVSGWNVSKVVNFNSTFRGMTSLTSLDLSNWETSSATDMFGMFLGDSSLTDLKVSKFDTSNVTDMRFMFQNNSSLGSLDVSNFILNSKVNAESLFEGTSSLKELDISNFVFTDDGSYLAMFRNMPVDAQVKVKDCSIDTWIFEKMEVTSDYPNGWGTQTNIIPPTKCDLKYDITRLDITSDDLLSFTDKSTISSSVVKVNGSNRNIYAKIKLQGTSSLTYPKKNYTITFYTDSSYSKKLSIDVNKGWGAQSKYCFKANYMDSTQSRNIVSARLAASMQAKYGLFEDAPNNGTIDGFFVELYVNGEYLGLYTMNIPKDDWMFNMDKKNENHIVLAAENPNKGTSTTFEALAPAVDGEDWSIEVGPNKTQEDVDQVFAKLNRVISFVKDSTVEEFRANITDYINLDALMNYYCFMALSNAVDNMNKNMLLVTYDGNIWYPSLYDLDTTWGIWFNGEGLYSATNKVTDYGGGTSLLFSKLVAAYPKELQERYFELRNSVLSNENIINQFTTFINSATSEQWAREKAKWPNIPGQEYGLSQISSHVLERGNYMDSVMLQLYHENKTYDDSRIIYKLENSFVGGINKFLDTGVNLYSKTASERKFTILVKVKSNSSGSSETIFSARNTSNYGMVVNNSGTGTDEYHMFHMGQNQYEALYKTDTNEYTTLIFTLNEDTYNMYSGSTSQKRTITSAVDGSDIGNVIIGADYWSNDTGEGFGSFFTGEVKEFVIYNEVLSDDEISELFTKYN